MLQNMSRVCKWMQSYRIHASCYASLQADRLEFIHHLHMHDIFWTSRILADQDNANCLSRVSLSCLSHVSLMSLSCPPHVFRIPFPCPSHVSLIPLSCHSHVSRTSLSWHSHVSLKSRSCLSPVSQCLSHVTLMSLACLSPMMSLSFIFVFHNTCVCSIWRATGWRGGGLGSSTIFKKFNEPYAPS